MFKWGVAIIWGRNKHIQSVQSVINADFENLFFPIDLQAKRSPGRGRLYWNEDLNIFFTVYQNYKLILSESF